MILTSVNQSLNVNVNSQVREMLRNGFTVEQVIESLELTDEAARYVRLAYSNGYQPVTVEQLVEEYGVDAVRTLHDISQEIVDGSNTEKLIRIKAAREILELRKNVAIERQNSTELTVGSRLIDMFKKLDNAVKVNESKLTKTVALN